MMERLLWVDLETTGLDPYEGQILEIFMVATDEHGRRERNEFHALVRRGDVAMCPFVAAMHKKSGLLKELDDPGLVHATEAMIDKAASDWIIQHELYDLPMAGSSPHFDRKWLELRMPLTAALFFRRNFDMSTVRYLFPWLRDEDSEADHRSKDDVAYDIGKYQEFLDYLKKAEVKTDA